MKLRTVAILLAIVTGGCSKTGDPWTAFAFPDAAHVPTADQVEPFIIGTFPSFERCQAAAVERLDAWARTGQTYGAYACGLACSHRSELNGLLVCEEIRK